LERDKVADLMAVLARDDLAMFLYQDLFNNNDPLPCPDAFVESLEMGFVEGIGEACIFVRKTLRP